jgi:XTP/dITP diphosphohydrolase
MEIRFLSSNEFKISETRKLLENTNIKIVPLNIKIEELQTTDENKLVKDKLLKAFTKIGKPIFVEHTGLFLEELNNMPGGLTQIFWDSLGHEKFSKIYGNLINTNAIAKTLIGYCDGFNLHFFEGKINGKISSEPKGSTDFQWDCIFIPDGETQTFAELGDKKNEISMRKKAIDKFLKFLKNGRTNSQL